MSTIELRKKIQDYVLSHKNETFTAAELNPIPPFNTYGYTDIEIALAQLAKTGLLKKSDPCICQAYEYCQH